MSKEEKVTVEMSVYQAAAVRESLFTDTKVYTYDPKSTPQRVIEIRDVIINNDNQLEEILNEKSNS